MVEPNTFTEDSYSEMWCRHRMQATANYSGAPVGNDQSVCVGKKCPALIIQRIEDFNGVKKWIGFCGADHQYLFLDHLNTC